MPNTTINGMLEASPFEKLLEMQLKGVKRSLFYTFIDENHKPVKMEIEYEHCVEPTSYRMILGDPFFKKFVVVHDMQDMKAKKMGLGIRKLSYDLSDEADNDFLGAFAYDSDIPDPGEAVSSHHQRGDHSARQAARAGLKEAASEERKEMKSPQDSMREKGGQGKKSPYKVMAKRVVTKDHEGSLAALRGTTLRENLGPVVEPTAAGSLDEIDDMPVQPSAEPWKGKVESYEEQQHSELMSGAVQKVRLNSDHIIYTIDLGVGTPPQKRTVVFDTGSYVLGIFSEEAPEGSEPLLKEDTMVSAAEADARKRYHILDLQRSTQETRSWLWGVGGQEGVTGIVVMASVCSLAVAALAMITVRRRRRGTVGERIPLNL